MEKYLYRLYFVGCNTENKTYTCTNLKSSIEVTAYKFFLKFVLMVKANVISSFIFIQDHKLNTKNIQLFLDAFLNLHF